MDVVEKAGLSSFISICLETNETDRLVRRLEGAGRRDLEDVSHYVTEPAAERLASSHPHLAGRIYRALAMRVVNAKKSRYYDAALENLERARRCYDRAGLRQEWDALIAEIRGAHRRKSSFMAGFARLLAGHEPNQKPSFLERARRRWSSRDEPGKGSPPTP
jgi:uncharacterized Zn finger protein